MSKIIVAGSINMDIVARMEHLPRPGETVFGDELHYIPGGKGSNQAVAASRLGQNVYFAGKLGSDGFGQTLTDFLQQEQLILDYLGYSDTHPTGIALITVDGRSENSIVVISGANFQVTEEDVAQIDFFKNDVAVGVFEIPQMTTRTLFQRAKAANAKTVLNPAPAAEFLDGLQETVDYLIVNETELAYFSGQDQVSEDMETIGRYARQFRSSENQTIIVTLGSKGIACIAGDETIRLEGIHVESVDTTGAGDCFTGAFAVAISEQMPLVEALTFANTAASISVQRLGASTSMPSREEVENAL